MSWQQLDLQHPGTASTVRPKPSPCLWWILRGLQQSDPLRFSSSLWGVKPTPLFRSLETWEVLFRDQSRFYVEISTVICTVMTLYYLQSIYDVYYIYVRILYIWYKHLPMKGFAYGFTPRKLAEPLIQSNLKSVLKPGIFGWRCCASTLFPLRFGSGKVTSGEVGVLQILFRDLTKNTVSFTVRSWW